MRKKQFSKNLTTRPQAQVGGLGEIRIIGGEWRGRKLPVLEQGGLRPTSDRIRETLFNWLQFELPGAVCLDAFAGSGALGFEAVSRGAASVLMLEKSALVATQLKHNLSVLKTHRVEVNQQDTLHYLSQPAKTRFDLVFIDPPFGLGLVQPTLDALIKYDWLNNQAWLYIEQEKSLDWPVLPSDWRLHREKTTSQVRLGLWHKPEYDEPH